MQCAGNKEIQTPNLDKLAKTGILFKNFFCVSPVCSPARASLLSGQIPSQHGIHDWLACGNSTIEQGCNSKLIQYLKGIPTYSDILAKNNYQCGIYGKWHLGDAHTPQKGFSHWQVHAKGSSSYYNAPMIKDGKIYQEPKYITDAITDNALQFLDKQTNSKKPFYLSIHYTAPHTPWSKENHPKELYEHYYNNCKFTSVPKTTPPPSWVQRLNIPVENQQTRKKYLAGYFTAITAMDQNIGRILDWLEQNNLRKNTLIFFTSDNGMNMGHHGIWGKGNATFPMNMFEESIKVPAIISQPETIPQNITCEQPLSHYDFMPTILDYLNIPYKPTKPLPGKSFAPILRGKPLNNSKPIIIYDEYGPVRMIRTKQWKYIHRYPNGPHELYNLKNDPAETTNLIDNPKHQPTITELRTKLNKWFEKYVDPNKDGNKQPITGDGQYGLNFTF